MSNHVELPEMEAADINGIRMEVHERGSGEPVLFIHAMRDEWYGVLAEPALVERYRLIYYHRRGHGQSDSTGLPLSVAQQAEDGRAVLEHFGVDRVHLTGLSLGGALALQLTVDFPEVVHSLALLEPTVPGIVGADPAAQEQLARIKSLFEAGEMAAGVAAFLEGIAGPGYEERFDQTLPPGWIDRYLADWAAFQHDIAAVQRWEFTQADAARISAPVLNMRATDSLTRHQQYHAAVQSWIPHAQSATLEDSTHPMPLIKPRETAERLVRFFAQHPMD